MSNMRNTKRPPLGIIPKNIYYERVELQRLADLCTTISRYYNAGLPIRMEWIKEYNELVVKYGEIINK